MQPLASRARRLTAQTAIGALAVAALLVPVAGAAPHAAASPAGVEGRAATSQAATVSAVAPQARTKARRSARTRHSAWAPIAEARITPGVMMYTRGAQCTANFVFTDAIGNVYVGYAAHCAGKGGATDTNGCQAGSRPLGTPVTFVRGGSIVSGGTRLGTGKLAYSSWHTQAAIGTTDPATCAYNDLALVKVDRRHVRKVNPTVPYWGGPTGIDRFGIGSRQRVYSFGNSSLRGGLTALSPKWGTALADTASDQGWSHTVYTATPGVPGDSGSGFLTRRGKALGTLSTVAIAPLPLSNNLGDLAKELAFAQEHSGLRGLRLAKGTRGFSSAF